MGWYDPLNAHSGQPIGEPLSVAFSLDGKTLASGSWDNTVCLWVVGIESWIEAAYSRATRNLTEHILAFKKTRIHDLRHTFVSFLLAKGTSPNDAQEIAGHSSVSVTMNTYGYHLPQAKKDVTKTINKLFNL